ncbi:ferredoxin reductase [Thiomicrorhabdus sp.]|uniref:ferredoxin reductase n=1 Tax=Thiomicrorhabdus sp. TaxID=2039724 RepID=UPI0029C8EE6C|nr:ferredoxin reductase [Thiomicrorhabdus sp.]
MSHAAIKVQVSDIQDVAPTIREFTFTPLEGEFFPFSPGSHIVVEMPSSDRTIRNAYSLLSDPRDASSYRIAVRLQPESRGGSIFMHQEVQKGDELIISPPSNLFAPDWRAKKHLFLAGGVGITPFMSYLPEMLRRKADFELHYLYRSTQTGAYCRPITRDARIPSFSLRLRRFAPRADIAGIMDACPQGTHIYICGPESLIDSVLQQAEQSGLAQVAYSLRSLRCTQTRNPLRC